MSKQPNIVIILSDDQGWGDLSRSGNTQLSTPRIDQLARDGATMEHFYVQPLCAPTRAELLTGRHFPSTGVKGVSRCAERINLDERTMGNVFLEAGYKTGCFGKWHSGMQYPYHPNGRGFTEFFGYCCGHWAHYFDTTIEHNGIEAKAEGYLTDALTTKAIDFIHENRDKPFLCYVPLNTPHSPFMVPDEWFDAFAEKDMPLRGTEPEHENLMATRAALAMCENIDWNVGRILDCLDKLSLSEETIVIYFSDNGPNGHRWNGGMKGVKGSCHEGGVRSPCSITWKGHIPSALVVQEISGAIDLLPTLVDLTEIHWDPEKEIDGQSLVPLLQEEKTSLWNDRPLFALQCYGGPGDFGPASLRTQRYRAYEDGTIYDLEKDIGESRDLSAEFPEESARLQKILLDWKSAIPSQKTITAIPIGYPEFPRTDLPAQDATPVGKVTWSCIHPNCSWFEGWTHPQDHITWEYDAQQAGEFDVTIMYACDEIDLGSRLSLAGATSSVEFQITDAFNSPPLMGYDRVPREESYEREFKAMEVGRLRLEKGLGQLTLRCLDMPGAQVCDLRAIRLTWCDDE